MCKYISQINIKDRYTEIDAFYSSKYESSVFGKTKITNFYFFYLYIFFKRVGKFDQLLVFISLFIISSAQAMAKRKMR
jgi:hypothetical protein